MSIRLEACGRTDVGIKRDNNEDAFAINLPGKDYPDGLFLVADGIGGLSRGEDASQLTIRTILKSYFAARSAQRDQQRDYDADNLLVTLREAVQSANASVLDESGLNARQRMGSTVAGMLIDGGSPRGNQPAQALVFNVGDTRVYQLRSGQIVQLSEDQVFQFPFESKDEDGNPRRATRLTAFIGQSTPLDPHFQRLNVQAGDMYILCSDGLWSLVEPQELRGVLTVTPFLETADRLIQLARERGAPDNITVIVVRVMAAQSDRLLRWLPVISAGGAAAALLIAVFLLLQTPLSTPTSVASAPTDPAIEILPTDAPSITILSTPTLAITLTEPATALPTTATVENDDLEVPESAGAQVAVQNAQTLSVGTARAQATSMALLATTQAALPSSTNTSTNTSTALPTGTPTATTTATFTASASATFSATSTIAPTRTDSAIPTATQTIAPSATVTISPTSVVTAAAISSMPNSVILPDGSELLTDTGLAYRLFRDNRRVRSGPATDYAVVAVIEAGSDPYPLLARYKDSTENWFLILLPDGQVGWVFHDTSYSEIIRSGGDLSRLPKILWATITPTP
ncbi:MAG: protein phosphatase 2C domain-containing protein [Anaerolineae bacterium]